MCLRAGVSQWERPHGLPAEKPGVGGHGSSGKDGKDRPGTSTEAKKKTRAEVTLRGHDCFVALSTFVFLMHILHGCALDAGGEAARGLGETKGRGGGEVAGRA